jgi:hypothetical protein
MSNAPNAIESFARDRSDGAFLSRGQRLAAAGGIIGALAASSCCILPVALFSLGIGGAWTATVIVTAAWAFNYPTFSHKQRSKPK